MRRTRTIVRSILRLTLCAAAAYQTEIDNLTKRAKAAENAFLSTYKVLAEAPDPYPLLEAALVRPQFASFTARRAYVMDVQDQAVRAAEAGELEAEVKRLRDENAELRRRAGEVAALEAAKKKVDARAEQLEAKVCTGPSLSLKIKH